MPLLTQVAMLPATIKQALALNVGQCINFPPDSVPLPRQRPARQLWPMRSLFLIDVYELNKQDNHFLAEFPTKQMAQIFCRQLHLSERKIVHLFFLKKMGHPRPLFLYFRLFNTQLTVNKCSI